jgi:hypothetical protein
MDMAFPFYGNWRKILSSVAANFRSYLDFIPAALLAVFCLICAAGQVMRPQPGQAMAALFPPWLSEDLAFAAAVSAGPQEILGRGGWSNVILARSDDVAFAGALRRAGAVLVVRVPRWSGCLR